MESYKILSKEDIYFIFKYLQKSQNFSELLPHIDISIDFTKIETQKASIHISRRRNFYILCGSKVIDTRSYALSLLMSITFDPRKT